MKYLIGKYIMIFIFGFILGTVGMRVYLLLWPSSSAPAETTQASWYSRKECISTKNPNALMANGEPLDDGALTCASWDYSFGAKLRVVRPNNGHSVVVTVTDRGPAKRLYKDGRTLDLSRRAFLTLAPLEVGVIKVTFSKIK